MKKKPAGVISDLLAPFRSKEACRWSVLLQSVMTTSNSKNYGREGFQDIWIIRPKPP